MARQTFILRIARHFPLLEKIALGAFVVGFLMKSMALPSGNEIVIISLSFLSGIYFLTAQVPVNASTENNSNNSKPGFFALIAQTIAPKILGIGSSACVTGILFTLMKWNGFRDMLIIGSSAVGAACILALLASSNDEENRKDITPRLVRAGILMMICFYFLWTYGMTDPTGSTN